MALRLPPLKALRVFEAAARHGSFTAAASELSITHSAVSQQIRLLEEFLGQALFAREARGVTVLPAAQAYYAEVQASLERIASATADFRSPRPSRVLRVATTPSLAMKWLIPRLAGFQQLAPEADVRLSTLNRPAEGSAPASHDVMIGLYPMQSPDHVCLRVLQDHSLPVASPRFVVRHRIREAGDCLGHPLLQMASRVGDWPRWLGLAGVQVPAQLPGPVFDHHFLGMEAAANDLGIAMVPWCLLEGDLRSRRLQPLFGTPPLVNEGVFALFREDDRAAPLTRRFVQWLQTQGNPIDAAEFSQPSNPPTTRQQGTKA